MNIEQKNADISQLITSAKVDPREVNKNSSALKTTPPDYDIDQRTEERKSSTIDPPEANPKPAAFKTTTSD